MPTSRFEPSSIKNKVKREEIARKQKKEKRQGKLQRRLAQAKAEADDPLLKKVCSLRTYASREGGICSVSHYVPRNVLPRTCPARSTTLASMIPPYSRRTPTQNPKQGHLLFHKKETQRLSQLSSLKTSLLRTLPRTRSPSTFLVPLTRVSHRKFSLRPHRKQRD